MPLTSTKKGGGAGSGTSDRLSTPSPTGKGGRGRQMAMPWSSGSKKRRQQQHEDVEPTDQLDDVLLLHAPASSPSPPDRLLLTPLDCRRLGVKAGDWVVIHSSPSTPSSPSSGTECQTPPRRGLKCSQLVALRAWPGSSGPSGVAAGTGPFILGQYPRIKEAGQECYVSIRALFRSVRQVAASEVALRVVPPDQEEGMEDETGWNTITTNSCSRGATAVLWKARLKDVLVGHLLYPGLRLTFASFAARATFEVVELTALEETSSSKGDQVDKRVSLPDLTALSLADKDSTNEGHDVTISNLMYKVGRRTRVRVVNRPPRGASERDVYEEDKPKIERATDTQNNGDACWATVGGLQIAVQEIREGVEQSLESPEVFAQHGLRPTRGLLVVGPSGTGKTTLLRAAAQYFADCKGYNVMRLGGPEFGGRLVGETETKLRQAFQEAKAMAPTVIVLDEVEALCLRRDATSSDLDKRMVATFLALLDGFQGMERVVVLAATSRPHALDSAVRRPGRLDREIDLGVPGEAARKDILKVLLRQAGPTIMKVSEEDMQRVASRAHGFVGADLLLVCKEAAMLAARRVVKQSTRVEEGGVQEGNVQVTGEDLLAGLARVRPSALREVAVEVPRVRWGDIGGMSEVKRALQECVEWPLTRPEAFVRMGIPPPKGVLLYGPPGCSKTLMARALATESGMNFLAVKGPELLSKWLGESEKALKALFKKARAAAPTVIFFDEVDALAGRRGEGEDSKASERVLSQLLTELDGVQPLRRVVVVAATNRPDLLDPALLRPGRIDRKVYVPPPDTASRFEILRIALRGMPGEYTGGERDGEAICGEMLNLNEIARRTEGFSGAEMVALCREAALCAIEEDPVNAHSLQGRHLDQVLTGWQRQITPQMLDFYHHYADGR